MPKEKRTPFPEGYTNWNYNWNQVYKNVYVETLSLNNLFPNDKRLSYDNIQRIDALLDNENDVRPTPNLIISENMNKVLCKESVDNVYEAETREKEQAKVQALREIVGDFCAALDEKQIEMAAVNPEGASLVRMMRDKADFALRDYGLEAMNDYSYSMIESQEGAIHMPDGHETSPLMKDFTRNIDEISDLPYLPVYENTSRMVRIACDHAIAARAGTLTEQQDRLSRKLLLTQYDHVSAGIEETLSVTGEKKVPEDFTRWASVMDNPPSDLGVYERGAFRVPYDMEGRRIALRQGWPVEDASMLGSLFVLHSQMTNPLKSAKKFLPSVQKSFEALLQEISSTRISSSEIRTEKLNRIFDFLSQNEKNLHLKNGAMGAFVDLWKRIKIQPCQYLSEQELDEAAQEYTRRSALPHVAGSDGSPVGYYEQILAGTEVLSRLIDLAQRIAPVNQGRKDLPEYDFMRNGVSKLAGMISAFYGPDAPTGEQRRKDMAQIENAHAALSDLAQSYLNAAGKSKKEPAFKKAAAEELRYYCAQIAKTAAATEIGLEAAENRRAKLDWRIEKEKAKSAAAQVQEPKPEELKPEEPKPEDPKVEEPKVEDPKVEESKVREPKVEESKVEESKVEESKVEDPKVEESKVEESKVREPKVEDPKVEESKVEESKVEMPKPVEERYDVTNQKPEVVGTLVNRRYGFQLPQEGGQRKAGFFTADLPLPTMDEEMAALNEHIAKLSPAAAKAIRVMEEKSSSFRQLSTDGLFSVPAKQQQNQEKYVHDWEYAHCYDSCLKEAGFSEKEIKNMATGAFAEAIDEYLTTKLQIEGRQDQYETIGVNPGETVALRNSAMSAVADALGVGSLLAASRPVTLVRHGQEVKGVFMEQAKGSDCMNPKADDPILKMTSSTPFSPKAQRELASMQVLDYICGNLDRHPGNLLYSFTKDLQGNLVLDGVQGIDNDMSFMGSAPDRLTTAYAVNTKILTQMPQSLADKVMQLDPDSLKNILQSFHLPEQQIQRAAERLADVQSQIASGKEYFRDKDLDAVSEEHIHVLPDEDYAKLSTQTHLANEIRNEVPKLAQTSLLEHDRVKVRNNFRKDERTLLSLYQRADETDKAVWFGSKEFENMKKALRTVGKQYSALLEPNEQDRQAGKAVHTPTREEMDEIRVSYTKLSQAVSGYLLRKQNEMERKGSLDKMSQARVKLAQEIQNMIVPQTEHVIELYSAQGREAQRAREAQRIREAELEQKRKTHQRDLENAKQALQSTAQLGMVLNGLRNRKQADANNKATLEYRSQKKCDERAASFDARQQELSDTWQNALYRLNSQEQHAYIQKTQQAMSGEKRSAASVYSEYIEKCRTSMDRYRQTYNTDMQNLPRAVRNAVGYGHGDQQAYRDAGYYGCIAFACTTLFKPDEPVDQEKLNALVDQMRDIQELKLGLQYSVVRDNKSRVTGFDRNSVSFGEAMSKFYDTIRKDYVQGDKERQHAPEQKLTVDEARNALLTEGADARKRYDAEKQKYEEAEQARKKNDPRQNGENKEQSASYARQPLPESVHNARSLMIQAAVADHLLEKQYPDRSAALDLEKLMVQTRRIVQDSQFMEKVANLDVNRDMMKTIQAGCDAYLEKQKTAEQKQGENLNRQQAKSKKKNKKPGLKV